MALSVHSELSSPEQAIVRLGGRPDARSFGAFDEAVLALLPQMADRGTLVVDLAGLEYVSSAALRSFALTQRSMQNRGGRTLLVHPQPQVRKVLDIVSAVPLSEVFTGKQEFDTYLRCVQQRVAEAGDGA